MSHEHKTYVCGVCRKPLTGKVFDYAQGRAQAFSQWSWKVSKKATELWNRSLSAVFCEECIGESDKWNEHQKVCLNCNHFALNVVRMPNVPEVYCMASTSQLPIKEIRTPEKETCEKWLARRPLSMMP